MMSMYNQLIRLYEGIINIDAYYSKGTPLNALQAAPQYVANALAHHAIVDNLDNADFGLLINIGEKDSPIYIAVVHNNEYKARTDIGISSKSASPVPIVIIPMKLFGTEEKEIKIAEILYDIFFGYMRNDPALSVNPEIELLNLPYRDDGTGIGHMLQTYDYTLIVVAMNVIHNILMTWFGKNTADSVLVDFLRDHDIVEAQIESVKTVCDEEVSFDYKIENGLYLKRFFE